MELYKKGWSKEKECKLKFEWMCTDEKGVQKSKESDVLYK